MKSELIGRLRNTHLPNQKGLIPVFEAVVNSIEAIEEKSLETQRPMSEFKIDLEISREDVGTLDVSGGSTPLGKISGFKITDNGIGFTDEHWRSFNTLDTLQKSEKGCRGVGRLMWLKAFKFVNVSSSFIQDSQIKQRKFSFSRENEVRELGAEPTQETLVTTTVSLTGFNPRYAQSSPKTLDSISQGLLDHCLW